MDQPGNHTRIRGNQPGAADRMRELLARTVQDHVADQRSSAGALEDIRQRLEGLEWLAREVREREMAGLTAQLDQLAGHLDQAAAKPPAWAESLAENVEQGVGKLQQSMETAAGRFSRLDQAVADLAQHTTQLDKEISGAKGRTEVGLSTLAA
jgi:chromosome segregation ATPase